MDKLPKVNKKTITKVSKSYIESYNNDTLDEFCKEKIKSLKENNPDLHDYIQDIASGLAVASASKNVTQTHIILVIELIKLLDILDTQMSKEESIETMDKLKELGDQLKDLNLDPGK